MDNAVAGTLFEKRDDYYFWYSREGYIVKWSIFLGLVGIIAIYIIGGYIHAKRRLKKGLLPLGYHRWLVSRRDLARVDPRYAVPNNAWYRPGYHNNAYYNNPQNPNGNYYGMNSNMAPPPPMYDPAGRPPVYDGPEGGSKVAPNQWTDGPRHGQVPGQGAEDYTAPQGPPPAGR